MAYPPTLASTRTGANFRGRLVHLLGLLISSFANDQDARVAGQGVALVSGPGAPTGSLGTNIRGVFLREDAPTTNTLFYLTVDGFTWDALVANSNFGATGIKADVVAESTSGAGVTIDGLLVKDKGIDASALLTGEFGLKVPTNKADAWSIYDSAGDLVVFDTTTGAQLITSTTQWAFTAGLKTDSIVEKTSGSGVDIDGVDLKDGGITTDGTKGAAVGLAIDDGHTIDIQINSLTGLVTFRENGDLTFNDSLGRNYFVMSATVPSITIGNATNTPDINFIGSVVDFALGLTSDTIAERSAGVGVTVDGLLVKDKGIDWDALATGEAYIKVPTNKADAWSIYDSAGDLVVFDTTTGSQKITITPKLVLSATPEVDAISEKSAGVGVTVDGVLLKDGDAHLATRGRATIVAAGGSAGSVDGTVEVAYKDVAGAAKAQVVQLMISFTATQYPVSPMPPPGGSVVWGAATKGSIISSGNNYALVQTDANGEFAAATTNANDETVYAHVFTPLAVSDASKAVQILPAAPSTATWSA